MQKDEEVQVELTGLEIYVIKDGQKINIIEENKKNEGFLRSLILNKGDKIIYDSLWNGKEMEVMEIPVKDDCMCLTNFIEVRD